MTISDLVTFSIKKFSPLFIFLFSSYSVLSSSVIPFPFLNSTWRYGQYDFSCSGPGNYCGQVIYKFQGDTVLQGKTYHKLFHTEPQDTVFNYAGAIRQDTLNGNLYIIFPSSQCNISDTLLYSFLWNELDTLKQCDKILGQAYSTINNIDSILILGQWRKRINLLGLYNTELIVGIGSTNGLIGPWEGWIGGRLQLECFELNGSAVYPGVNCGVNGVPLNHSNPMSFNIYPAIAQSELFVSIDNNVEIGSLTVELFSINGNLVLSQLINSSHSNTIKFSTSNLTSGIYYLFIKRKMKAVGYKKIIILP